MSDELRRKLDDRYSAFQAWVALAPQPFTACDVRDANTAELHNTVRVFLWLKQARADR